MRLKDAPYGTNGTALGLPENSMLIDVTTGSMQRKSSTEEKALP